MADNPLTNFIVYSQKYGGSDTSLITVCPSLTPELQSFIREGGLCTVLDQPIPLDRLILKNIEPIHVTGMCLHTLECLHKHHVNALRVVAEGQAAVCPQTTLRCLERKHWCLSTAWLHGFAPAVRRELLPQTPQPAAPCCQQ